MRFIDTNIAGVKIIELERFEDERGSFARSFCVDEFAAEGIPFTIDQASISFNRHRGTLRGMHIQVEPSPEMKIVRCTRGRLYDVVLDLRCESDTYCSWIGVELDPENGNALLIPGGCAHGFQTLNDDTEVHYMMQGKYDPGAATGVRFDDPAFGIEWPLAATEMSDKDSNWADFDREAGLAGRVSP